MSYSPMKPNNCWSCGLPAPSGVCTRSHGPGQLAKGKRMGMILASRKNVENGYRALNSLEVDAPLLRIRIVG